MKFNLILFLLTTLAAVALTSPLPNSDDAAVESLLKTSEPIPANASITCAGIKCDVRVTTKHGKKNFKKFKGIVDAFGNNFAGDYSGNVYTNNPDRLYEDTKKVEVRKWVGFSIITINFMESDDHLLGVFEGKAGVTKFGYGIGFGKWS